MAKFNFNLRSELNSKGESVIYLVIRWDNNKLVYPTGESINPKFWETDKKKKTFQRAIQTKQFPEYPEFNARLDKIEKDAKDAFRQYENDNNHKHPTPEKLRELINKKLNPEGNKTPKSLFNFIDKFIIESETKVNSKTGKTFSQATIQVYSRTNQTLKEFSQAKKKRVDFDTIDLDFYQDFKDYLRKDLNYSTNTIGKYVKTLKTFLNEATERGLNNNYAYKSKRFIVDKEDTDSIYLNESELNEIASIDLSDNPRLDKVRDLFLVGCYTGLRFSDFSNIRPENIIDGYIDIETKKTAEPVVIPIHHTVKAIMQKYKGKYENSLPPAISNVKMNQYVKELGQMIRSLHSKTSTSITKGGLNITRNNKKYELITTHTARRSFATNQYLDGVPSFTIMKITGHRTEKSFLRYIKVTPQESAKILKLHWENRRKQVST